MMSEPWYRENMPPFKAAFEDGTITIPADRDTQDDLRCLQIIRGVARVYIVPGLRNAAGDLWKPNQLVTVTDCYGGIDQDMLIAAVTWVAEEGRYETRISVVDPDAFDLTGDEDHTKPGARKAKHLTARSLIGRG